MDKDDPDVQDKEVEWVACAQRGAQQLNARRLALTRSNWQHAADLAGQLFDPGDPRRAASWNNLAVLARFTQQMAEAERLYRRALAEWERAADWIECMEPTMVARSSVFHMQLELKHRPQFARWAFADCHRLQAHGIAVTLSNQAEWHQWAGYYDDAARLYEQALSRHEQTAEAFAYAAEVMRSNRAACASAHARADAANVAGNVWAATLDEPFMALARRESWVIDRPPMFTDEGRFRAGLSCICLVCQRPEGC